MASLATTLIDRFVGYINPNAGLRRLRAREMLTRAYEGASQKDGWRPRRSGASANTDHLADGAILRTRARALVQNVPYIARGLESLVSNTIGTGITPRSLSTNATAVDKLWNEWAKVCDADGCSDLYGLQALAYRAMEQDGEVLIRLRARRPEDGLPVPLQIQVLEIDWLDSSKMGANGSNTILNGIEYDQLGKIVYYWLWDQHPGELVSGRRAKTSSYPVPAARTNVLPAKRWWACRAGRRCSRSCLSSRKCAAPRRWGRRRSTPCAHPVPWPQNPRGVCRGGGSAGWTGRRSFSSELPLFKELRWPHAVIALEGLMNPWVRGKELHRIVWRER